MKNLIETDISSDADVAACRSSVVDSVSSELQTSKLLTAVQILNEEFGLQLPKTIFVLKKCSGKDISEDMNKMIFLMVIF